MARILWSVFTIQALALSNAQSLAGCNDTIPEELRLPKINAGVDYTEYETRMDGVLEVDPARFEELFKEHVQKFNNISGSIVSFPTGEKHVYRSAMLAYSPETIRELVKERGVENIFHISNTKVVTQDVWVTDEKKLFEQFGGDVAVGYHHVKDFDYQMTDDDEIYGPTKVATDIIKLIRDKPGHAVVHCLGGEHKTEIIFEIMQRCYNKVPDANIIERYKCHTAHEDDQPTKKSGYKQSNIDFILNFPCDTLEK